MNLFKIKFLNNFLLSLFLFWISSCLSKSNDTRTELIGTWVLDSISSPKNGFYKADNDKAYLVFKDSARYSFEQWNGDAGYKISGNYYVHRNEASIRNTIVFIPDLEISKKDTLRRYMNYDIVLLSKNTLKVVSDSKLIKTDGSTYKPFNKQYIYKLRIQ